MCEARRKRELPLVAVFPGCACSIVIVMSCAIGNAQEQAVPMRAGPVTMPSRIDREACSFDNPTPLRDLAAKHVGSNQHGRGSRLRIWFLPFHHRQGRLSNRCELVSLRRRFAFALSRPDSSGRGFCGRYSGLSGMRKSIVVLVQTNTGDEEVGLIKTVAIGAARFRGRSMRPVQIVSSGFSR